MSFDPPTPDARRERAIRLTVAASVAAKVFSVLCTFAQVPLALHYLGREAYGFWVTLGSIVLILNSVDFGLGVGMQHAMAQAFGRDDEASIRRAFWTGTAALAALGLAIFAVGVGTVYLAPWADILKVGDPELRAETRRALSIAIAAFALGLPFGGVNRLAAALQRGWVNAGWVAAGNACSLALVVAAAYGHWGFLWFLALSLIVPVLQGVALLLHLCGSLGWRPYPDAFASGAEIRTLLRSSVSFAFPQLGGALIQSAPALAISVAAGSAAVTGYNLLMRLFGPIQQGQILVLTPIWPAYTEAHARNDHRWVGRTFRRTVAATGAMAFGVALLAWQSPRILGWWVGPAAGSVTLRFAAAVASWCILQMATQTCIYYLVGVGRLRQLAWSASPGYFITAATLFGAASLGTSLGVIFAGSLSLALALLPALVVASCQALRQASPTPQAA